MSLNIINISFKKLFPFLLLILFFIIKNHQNYKKLVLWKKPSKIKNCYMWGMPYVDISALQESILIALLIYLILPMFQCTYGSFPWEWELLKIFIIFSLEFRIFMWASLNLIPLYSYHFYPIVIFLNQRNHYLRYWYWLPSKVNIFLQSHKQSFCKFHPSRDF